MNIVILDKATIGNDIDLKNIELEGNLISYDITKKENTIERIKDADIIITNKVIIGKKELNKAKKLKLICVAATGYNNIDIDEANKKKIVVANVKAYSTNSVAQHTINLILTIQNSFLQYNDDIKKLKWQKSAIFTLLNYPIYELTNKKIGIIGYGTIGKRVAEILKAFGAKIMVSKIPKRNYNDDFRYEFETVLKESDIISIHAPLTSITKNLIGKNEFSLMKNSAILINTARGGIVNENDLYEALITKKIRAASFDVLTEEPPSENLKKLFELDNLIITPHIAWTSKESRTQLVAGILNNIKEYKRGNIDKINIL